MELLEFLRTRPWVHRGVVGSGRSEVLKMRLIGGVRATSAPSLGAACWLRVGLALGQLPGPHKKLGRLVPPASRVAYCPPGDPQVEGLTHDYRPLSASARVPAFTHLCSLTRGPPGSTGSSCGWMNPADPVSTLCVPWLLPL